MSTQIVGDPRSNQPWLVLVHGMLQCRLVFDRQVREFSATYRILLVDLPGHGLASGHDGPFGHIEYANHVMGALNENDIDKAHYWGTHTGTAAGLIIALTSPERFASLVMDRRRVVRAVFADAYNYMKSGQLMRQVVNRIGEVNFNDLTERRHFGDIYEQILNDLQSAGNAGEYYTPRAVNRYAGNQEALARTLHCNET